MPTASAAPLAGSLHQIEQATQVRDLLHNQGRLAGAQLTNDLRLRVLEGEDLEADEMLLIVNDIRRDRRAAARPPTASPVRRTKTEARPVTAEDLRAILEQED